MANEKNVYVMGYLAGNWPNLNDKTPALMINPEASPLDMLAWCWGEVASMQSALDALAAAQAPIEPGELSGIFLHRMAPLERVLSEAISALIALQGAKVGGV